MATNTKGSIMASIPRVLLGPIALAALATPAPAATYMFTLSGGLTGSWTLPARPVPDIVFIDAFRIQSVSGVFNGSPFTAMMEFFSSSAGGGVCAGTFCSLFDLYGEQLFTRTPAAPIFKLGSFPMYDSASDTARLLATISIAKITRAIPEPAAWTMLIAGFGLVGNSLRRRRAATA